MGGIEDYFRIHLNNSSKPSTNEKANEQAKPAAEKKPADDAIWLDKKSNLRTQPQHTETNKQNQKPKDIQIFNFNQSGQNNPVSRQNTTASRTTATAQNTASQQNTAVSQNTTASANYSSVQPQKASATQKTSSAQSVAKTSTPKAQTSKTTQATSAKTKDEATIQAELSAIENIEDNLNSALDTFFTQVDEEGVISRTWNSAKEYFDANLSKSSVCRTLFAEQKSVDLLKRAQNNELTKEEYLGAKLDLAIELLCTNGTFSEEDKNYIKEYLLDRTPDELDDIISKLKTLPNDHLDSLNNYSQKLIEEGKKIVQREVQSQAKHTEQGEFSKMVNTNSIRGMLKNSDAKELMTFDETYFAERKTAFSKENVEAYDEKTSQFMLAKLLTQKQQTLHETIGKKLETLKDFDKYGGNLQGREQATQNLKHEIVTCLKNLYGDDEQAISEALKKYTDNVKFENGKFITSEGIALPEDMIITNIAEGMLKEVDNNINDILEGKSLEDCENELGVAYKNAYGEKNAKELAQAFTQDQEAAALYARQGVELAGAGIMVAGMFIAPPLAMTGGLISSFGGIGVEALNESTRKSGMSEETKSKILKELAQNSALLAAGAASGAAGSAAKSALLAQKCPTLVASIADIGADATLSLIGDKIITGEIDIEGEGLSQLLSLVAGHCGKIKAARGNNTKVENPTAYTPPQASPPKFNSENFTVEHIQKVLRCNDKLAASILREVDARPEIKDKLIQIVNSGNLSCKSIIKMATPENIDDLIALSKNRNFRITYDIDTDSQINDFQAILDLVKEHPECKDTIMKMATEQKRFAKDITTITEYMDKYPQYADDFLEIASSNPTVKAYDSLNNTKGFHYEELNEVLNDYPQFKNEILDFIKTQRYDTTGSSDMRNPIDELRSFIHEISTHPERKDLVVEFTKNPNLKTSDVIKLLTNEKFQPLEENMDIIRRYSQRNYALNGIERTINLTKKYPELRELLTSEPPEYDLIDKTPANTPAETIRKRFATKDNIEKFASEELNSLKETLGDDFFVKVKWEEIIPENASHDEVKKILHELNDKSKFFARTYVNESTYGKNIQWAHQMYTIEQCAQTMLTRGESFDDVMDWISKSYHDFDVSKTLDCPDPSYMDQRRLYSGQYRGDLPDNSAQLANDLGAWTGYNKNGDYSEYADRLDTLLNQRREYNGIRLTEARTFYDNSHIMAHPMNSNAQKGMDYIKKLNENLNPLFEKVKNGEVLSEKDKALANETISEMYFVMANIMPYSRGSNGIADIMMRSLYEGLGIEMPAVKRGVSLDLEAFTMNAAKFKKNWMSFFE